MPKAEENITRNFAGKSLGINNPHQLCEGLKPTSYEMCITKVEHGKFTVFSLITSKTITIYSKKCSGHKIFHFPLHLLERFSKLQQY